MGGGRAHTCSTVKGRAAGGGEHKWAQHTWGPWTQVTTGASDPIHQCAPRSDGQKQSMCSTQCAHVSRHSCEPMNQTRTMFSPPEEGKTVLASSRRHQINDHTAHTHSHVLHLREVPPGGRELARQLVVVQPTAIGTGRAPRRVQTIKGKL